MDWERIDDLIALAALGELTADESAELDACADADPEVAAELIAALDAAAALQTAELEAPPAGLRRKVLDSVAAHAEPNTVAVLTDARRSRRTRLTRQLLPIAAALVLSIGVGIAVFTDDGDSPAEQIAAVLRAPDRTERTLKGELMGSLSVSTSSSEKALVIEAEGLDPLADSETYQVWFVRDGGVESVGTFRPERDGTVAKRFSDVRPGDAVVAITLEPAGGSKEPTLPILASA